MLDARANTVLEKSGRQVLPNQLLRSYYRAVSRMITIGAVLFYSGVLAMLLSILLEFGWLISGLLGISGLCAGYFFSQSRVVALDEQYRALGLTDAQSVVDRRT